MRLFIFVLLGVRGDFHGSSTRCAPAGLLLVIKVLGAEIIASVTFIAILMTILIQAATTKWIGQILGLLEGRKSETIRTKKR